MLTVTAFDHIVLNVRDVETSAAWYEEVLGMERKVSQHSSVGQSRTSMVFGRKKINLRPTAASQESWFTADTPAAGSVDICFLTEADPDAVMKHFDRCNVPIVTGPVTKQGALGPICSVYVRDPDGNLIEVSSYV
ncbi:catechol 2,3-dioxygenase-like lactoylglutathione lyase family enzyme [Agrobacterium larrymoorei]|uniref:Catechol 2,3-dioxygenase-like lactoylglutathione lyase family enzyme n=1 Tax=Agrobacterium larrymoorei TaxID=160699 RepID=A0AAJ2B6X5_9HYPH|nr:VOC family protein [Agrobacterium larrymoorei]MDR6100515.1 catechol 2,3-dioxygenase-like lactoylglutathione lyase family enzyme [Agrobacterium larrymoorei]